MTLRRWHSCCPTHNAVQPRLTHWPYGEGMDPPEHMDTQTGLDTQLPASKHIQLFLEQHHDTAARPVSSINTKDTLCDKQKIALLLSSTRRPLSSSFHMK